MRAMVMDAACDERLPRTSGYGCFRCRNLLISWVSRTLEFSLSVRSFYEQNPGTWVLSRAIMKVTKIIIDSDQFVAAFDGPKYCVEKFPATVDQYPRGSIIFLKEDPRFSWVVAAECVLPDR